MISIIALDTPQSLRSSHSRNIERLAMDGCWLQKPEIGRFHMLAMERTLLRCTANCFCTFWPVRPFQCFGPYCVTRQTGCSAGTTSDW